MIRALAAPRAAPRTPRIRVPSRESRNVERAPGHWPLPGSQGGCRRSGAQGRLRLACRVRAGSSACPPRHSVRALWPLRCAAADGRLESVGTSAACPCWPCPTGTTRSRNAVVDACAALPCLVRPSHSRAPRGEVAGKCGRAQPPTTTARPRARRWRRRRRHPPTHRPLGAPRIAHPGTRTPTTFCRRVMSLAPCPLRRYGVRTRFGAAPGRP
ncbi:hypothetical protein SEVIR_7G230402v4 [Setaria viridis]